MKRVIALIKEVATGIIAVPIVIILIGLLLISLVMIMAGGLIGLPAYLVIDTLVKED